MSGVSPDGVAVPGHVAPGWPDDPAPFTPAEYREQAIRAYAGHPYIEALPPLRSRPETAALLARYLDYGEDDRSLPLEVRSHLVAQIPGFFQPLTRHLELDDRLSRMIRIGYLGRNPLTPSFHRRLEEGVQALSPGPQRRPPRVAWTSATSMTVLGISGIGKTTALEASLDLYPQVIAHGDYQGRALPRLQVVWLKLDCPGDGSIKGLCINFFQAIDALLGTSYERHYTTHRATVDTLLPSMARVAAQHGLGLLVIDEIQHLSAARSGGERRMLNFFVQLVNTIGLPVVLVGTYRAQAILSAEFRQARRGAGQGDFVWDRMAHDGAFRLFCETLWEYQYVRERASLTDAMLAALYDESQGVTDFVVKLFVLAQHRAMTTGLERVEPNLIRSVAVDSLRLARPILQALKHGDVGTLLRLDDVLPLSLDDALPGRASGDSLGDSLVLTATTGTTAPAARADGTPSSGVPAAHVPSMTDARGQTSDARGRTGIQSMGAPSCMRPTDAATHGTEETVVSLVVAGRGKRQSAHDALAAHGLIRDLGAEVLRAGDDSSPAIGTAP